MEFLKIHALRGPNIWAYFPVIEAWVDLGELNDTSSDSIPGFNERLMSWLPGMIEHRCSVGERGGFFERLRRGTYPAHMLEHVTIELQTLAGSPVGYGRARASSKERIYKVVFKYKDETLARACLEAGRELLLAAIHDRPFDLAATVARLRAIASEHLMDPGTDAIVQAARARNIPFLRLDGGNLVQLGTGARQRRIQAAATDRTGAIAVSIARNEELTRTLLRSAGLPVSGAPGEGSRYRLLVVSGRLAAAALLGPAQAGGEDVTSRVHPETAAQAILAARIAGLDIAGIEIAAEDIALPLEPQHGAVVSIDSSPNLEPYLSPAGAAIVDSLFPPGDTGRIPIAAITGTRGKTTVARLLAHLLQQPGRPLGMTSNDGGYLDGRRIVDGDGTGATAARRLLTHPLVECAVLETGLGGILEEGLAFNECQVAVVTNIGEGDHLGMGDVQSSEDVAKAKSGIVELVAVKGAAILNASDPLAADMGRLCPGEVIYFALDPAHAVLAPHLEAGKRAVFVWEGQLILATGGSHQPLLAISEVPLTQGGRVQFEVENTLAAAAAAWALDVPPATIAARLRAFAL